MGMMRYGMNKRFEAELKQLIEYGTDAGLAGSDMAEALQRTLDNLLAEMRARAVELYPDPRFARG